MRIIKTLILTGSSAEAQRINYEANGCMTPPAEFAVEVYAIPYGAQAHGLRYDKLLHINVADSERNAKYDEYITIFKARAGFYEQMREAAKGGE